jgi:signal transduction histidine kinase
VLFEILVSLSLVMITATGLLATFMVRSQSVQLENLQTLIGRALREEANQSSFPVIGGSPGVAWWISENDSFRPLGLGLDAEPETPDPVLEALAESARIEGSAVVGSGRPWEPLRFAVPVIASGEIAIARIEPAVSGSVLIALLLTDSVVFIAMGGFLLRRRVAAPLLQLAAAAREIGQGARGMRVQVDGDGEAAEVAVAFNEMTEALEQRSLELEKAVSELRDSNRSLRRARDGLDRAERLASVGSLAAGVAHEVGNPMGALLAFLDLAKRDDEMGSKTREHLNRASEQGTRVREILRQLLDFSRPPRSVRMPLDVASVAKQTLGLIRAQSRFENVELEMIAGDGLVPAVGDESVVAQILLNLMLNACDAALDAAPPARVTVTVRPAPLVVRSGDAGDWRAARRSMDGVECEVADSGDGVREEDRERIFDPFFTTKDPGVGTGLGLANALQLAEELGGVVELKREGPLAGAAFVLRLPIEGAVDGEVRGSG